MLAHRSSRGAEGPGWSPGICSPYAALLGRADGDGGARHRPLGERIGPGELTAVRRRVGARPAQDLLVRQRGLAVADLLREDRHLLELDRPDVDAVDAGHRRDVAGAEALEVADVDVGVLGHLVLDRVEQLVAAAQRARDVRADVDAVAADGPRVELVVEGGDRDDVPGREPHDRRDLRDRQRRAPAVQALGGRERGDRRRPTVGVLGHVAFDLRPQVRRDLDGRRIGDGRGVLGGVDGLVPAGDARPVRVAGDLVAEAHGSSGRSRPGWGRASRGSR